MGFQIIYVFATLLPPNIANNVKQRREMRRYKVIIREATDGDFDLDRLLRLYEEHFPENERFTVEDFRTIVASDSQLDLCGVKGYLIEAVTDPTADTPQTVAGLLYAVYSDARKLLFVHYVCHSQQFVERTPGYIVNELLDHLLRLIRQRFQSDCDVIFEVDDPEKAPTDAERRHRRARLELFRKYSERKCLAIARCEIPYEQPCLKDDPDGKSVPLCLAIACMNTKFDRCATDEMSFEHLTGILQFVYFENYGALFRAAGHSRDHRDHLSTLYIRVLKQIETCATLHPI